LESVFFVPSSSHLNERLVGLARAGFGRDVGAQIAHIAAFLDRAVQQLPWLREKRPAAFEPDSGASLA
jgi:hypothetical protein